MRARRPVASGNTYWLALLVGLAIGLAATAPATARITDSELKAAYCLGVDRDTERLYQKWLAPILGSKPNADALWTAIRERRMLFRLLLGFAAGMISTVSFHAAAWEALYSVGLMSVPPYSMALTSYDTPFLLNLAIARGLWGAAFGVAWPRTALPAWLGGLLVGLACRGFEWIVAFAGNGHWTMTGAWALYPAQAVFINGCWGIGVGLILRLLYRATR